MQHDSQNALFALTFKPLSGKLETVNEEPGERFHQDVQKMESRYQGKSSITILVDCVLVLQQDYPGRAHKRTCRTRKFLSKINRFMHDEK